MAIATMSTSREAVGTSISTTVIRPATRPVLVDSGMVLGVKMMIMVGCCGVTLGSIGVR